MLTKQGASLRQLSTIAFLCLCIGFICHLHTPSLYGDERSDIVPSTLEVSAESKSDICSKQTLIYYLNVTDFADSFIEIPTSNVSGGGTTISSKYLAGRAPLYNVANVQVGTCSASFLCMQTAEGIFTDISNFISVDNGLIVTWFTPTTLINLELDTIINSMVTECTVVASTKVGFAPFFGQTFDLIVSSDSGKIYFQFTRIGTIF